MELRKAVARKYEAQTTQAVIIRGRRRIDLRTLTLKEADALVKAGNFPYLKKKTPVKKEE